MDINEITVPEGKVVCATMAVRELATDKTLVGNVIFEAEIVEQDPPSDELVMLAYTTLAICDGRSKIVRTLREMGYIPIIEDDDDCLASDLVPDDISGLE